jgi:hypothetical protein
MRVCVAALLAALALAPAATGAPPSARLTEDGVLARFLAVGKVADWLGRYDADGLRKDAEYDEGRGKWTVRVSFEPAGQVALGTVDDATGRVEEAWTGPQVAWPMARGHDGSFGGKHLDRPPLWLALCAIFVLGLADLRRPLSIKNLDLLVLVSLSASLFYFNAGRIFTSVPLVYPALLYLLGRTIWIGVSGRSVGAKPPVWPVWLLAAATVFLAGFRIGLNVSDSSLIDVGYAGVIGAHRIASGQAPYGHFPVERGTACAPPRADGRTVYRIQENGRCEAANEHGDTYGPVTYYAYLPGFAIIGWKGKGDKLGAAHFTSVVFDLVCIAALALVGLRYGGRRLAVTLAFAWAAYPFTQYVSSSNSNDAIQPALLVLGFWLASSPSGRGAFAALASWTKFAPLVVVPLWATYPDVRRPRGTVIFATAFLLATLAAFWVLLLEPDVPHAARVFWDRTIGQQIDRRSPFSLWDWRQYHAGLPDLHVLQRVLQVALVLGALAVAVVPRRKSPLQLAALTAALLIGFEVVLTHWFYLYVAWFFPFVAIAVLMPEQKATRADRSALVPPGESSPPTDS